MGMKKRMIGNLEVSEIGMGCMGFSHGYGAVPEESYSIEAIQKAYDFGCTFFDTAEGYGTQLFYPGHNEQLLGKAAEPFRKDVVLATKLFLSTEERGEGNRLYESVRKHLDVSLVNLKTDYVDLYYLHRVNPEIPNEEVAAVMGKLIKEGLIRGWGMSQVSAETLAKAHNVTPVAAVQNIYSIMERSCEEDIFPYCTENNIGVVPFSPIASGFLSGKVTTETKFEGDDVRMWVQQTSPENIVANQPILDVMEKFAARNNASYAQLSLAWMLHKYPNAVPIPGSKNQERILENLAACNVHLTDEEFTAFEAALAECTLHGHRGHVEERRMVRTSRPNN